MFRFGQFCHIWLTCPCGEPVEGQGTLVTIRDFETPVTGTNRQCENVTENNLAFYTQNFETMVGEVERPLYAGIEDTSSIISM